MILSNIYYYVRQPETIGSGFVKLGSIIALLKLGVLLSLFHQYLMKREIQSRYFTKQGKQMSIQEETLESSRRTINENETVEGNDDLLDQIYKTK